MTQQCALMTVMMAVYQWEGVCQSLGRLIANRRAYMTFSANTVFWLEK